MSKTRNKTNTASGAGRLAIVSAVILLRGPTVGRVFRIPATGDDGLSDRVEMSKTAPQWLRLITPAEKVARATGLRSYMSASETHALLSYGGLEIAAP